MIGYPEWLKRAVSFDLQLFCFWGEYEACICLRADGVRVNGNEFTELAGYWLLFESGFNRLKWNGKMEERVYC